MSKTIKSRIAAMERAEGMSETDPVYVRDGEPVPANLGKRPLVRIVHEFVTPMYREDGTVIPRAK